MAPISACPTPPLEAALHTGAATVARLHSRRRTSCGLHLAESLTRPQQSSEVVASFS